MSLDDPADRIGAPLIRLWVVSTGAKHVYAAPLLVASLTLTTRSAVGAIDCQTNGCGGDANAAGTQCCKCQCPGGGGEGVFFQANTPFGNDKCVRCMPDGQMELVNGVLPTCVTPPRGGGANEAFILISTCDACASALRAEAGQICGG
jgi:hypothetical protein